MQSAFYCYTQKLLYEVQKLLYLLRWKPRLSVPNREETPQQKPYRAWGPKLDEKTEN